MVRHFNYFKMNTGSPSLALVLIHQTLQLWQVLSNNFLPLDFQQNTLSVCLHPLNESQVIQMNFNNYYGAKRLRQKANVLCSNICVFLLHLIFVYLVVYCPLNVPYLFVVYSFAAYLVILLVHLFVPHCCNRILLSLTNSVVVLLHCRFVQTNAF